ncbi:MAG: hypothetical protein WBE08_09160 [Methyloceanibacter sp.]
MLPFTRIEFLRLASAGVLVALTAANSPARSEELLSSLGPVGPHEPILTTVGNKRVIAFYVRDGGHCAVNAVVWGMNPEGDSAARVRVSLNPRQIVHIDSADNKTLNLQCGDRAETLAIVDTSERIAFGARE